MKREPQSMGTPKKAIRKVLPIILLLPAFIIGCMRTPPVMEIGDQVSTLPSLTPSKERPTSTSLAASASKWWNGAVFYEIFVRSFYDSDQDGIGDFIGILDKLDYLNDGDPNTSTDLGITAIWLMPIMPSPSTHGYDVTDFYGVNPEYGSMEEFKELLDECHQRGIKVIIDLPLNHTSSQHPWFLQSQDPQSPLRDWYIWSDDDPGYPGPWNQVVWHPLNGHYFYGYFWEGMPDLNYQNAEVTAEMENIVRFWVKDIGVDGYRLDAIGALIEDGSQQEETPATHQWFREFNRFVKELDPNIFTVGEVWNPNEIVVPYIRNREVDLAFNFDLSFSIIKGINENNPAIIMEQVQKAKDLFPDGRYGAFITNHDMERAITQLGGDPEKAKAAASIYLTQPGVPFIYYGEEIGMGGIAPDEQCRLPMQWSSDQNAGFTTTNPWISPQTDYQDFNVQTEGEDPASLLSHYKMLIALRSEEELFRNGTVYINQSQNPSIYSILLARQGSAILEIVNLSNQEIENFSISQSARIFTQGLHSVTDLLGNNSPMQLESNKTGGFQDYQPVDQIPGFGTLIFKIEPSKP